MTSNKTSSDSLKKSDDTFRNYAPAQAKAYAQFRKTYPPQLVSTVIELHKSTSSDPENCFSTVVDVGCGPGNATGSIAPFFDRAIGLDPGQSMIETARSLGGQTRTKKDIEWAVTGAERIDETLAQLGVWDGKHPCVDLITAATAAHWFDLPLFFSAAAKVLKPGGSVIFWANGSLFVDDQTNPPDVVAKANQLLTSFQFETLRPYELDGNILCRNLYADLVMPWDVDQALRSELGIDVFDKGEYFRKTWNENGKSDPSLEGGWMSSDTGKWAFLKYALGTASPVTRFRQRNKEALEKGEMEDCVDVVTRNLRACFPPDQEAVTGCQNTVVVMVKMKK